MRNLWRLATTLGGLSTGHVHFLGLPQPSCTFSDFAQEQTQGDGGTKTIGYKSAVLTFSFMSKTQVSTLSDLVSSARDAGEMFATVIRNSGNSDWGWVDISGKPSSLNIQLLQGEFSGMGASTVTLTINNVTIENEPSDYL